MAGFNWRGNSPEKIATKQEIATGALEIVAPNLEKDADINWKQLNLTN